MTVALFKLLYCGYQFLINFIKSDFRGKQFWQQGVMQADCLA
jgi:hypothetical protein